MRNEVTIDEDCPFPGCGLHAEHDGNHVPKLRLVQRFTWTKGHANHPGSCELEGCYDTAVALYARAGEKKSHGLRVMRVEVTRITGTEGLRRDRGRGDNPVAESASTRSRGGNRLESWRSHDDGRREGNDEENR